jgi:hypothetical protein
VDVRLSPVELELLRRAEQVTRRQTKHTIDRREGSIAAYVRWAALEQAARDLTSAALRAGLAEHRADLAGAITGSRSDLPLLVSAGRSDPERSQ